jgi:lactoylglutathione lyase
MAMTAPDGKKDLVELVPLLGVASMEASLRHYVDGLGFVMKNKWEPDGVLRWCWLTRGAVSLMLQLGRQAGDPRPGVGVSLCIMCGDAVALYHELRARGIDASEPEVGNGLWVTTIFDPDGYRLELESPTDVPEDTKLSELPAFSNRNE